jgi:hypothetical protein
VEGLAHKVDTEIAGGKAASVANSDLDGLHRLKRGDVIFPSHATCFASPSAQALQAGASPAGVIDRQLMW